MRWSDVVLPLLALSFPANVSAQDAALPTPPPTATAARAPTPPMGWNSWNKFACSVDEAAVRRVTGRDRFVRHARRGLSLRRYRRLLAWRPHCRRLHHRRCQALPVRHQGAGRLCSRARIDVRHLFRRRGQDLRRPSGQPGPRISGRVDLRPLGGRLSQIRLVQHGHAQCRGSLQADGQRAAGERPPDRPVDVRMGSEQALAVGPVDRQSVAHDRRHHRQMVGQAWLIHGA